jgi:hypothetical protein
VGKWDYALVGHGIYAYMVGIKLLREEKSVVIQRGSALQSHHVWEKNLSTVEKYFLKEWGRKYQIPCLKHLENYLYPIDTLLVIGDKRVQLGSSPQFNALEILRKLPFFSSEYFLREQILKHGHEFNLHFEQSAQDLARRAFAQGTEKTLSSSVINQTLDAPVKKLVGELYEKFQAVHRLKNREHFQYKHFIYLIQSFFQGHATDEMGPENFYHWPIALLNQQYQLHAARLCQELRQQFLRQGGKEIALETALDLALEKKVVTKVLRLSSHQEDFLTVEPVNGPGEFYRALTCHIDLGKNIFSGLERTRVLFSAEQDMGTRNPFWEFAFPTPFACRMVSASLQKNQISYALSMDELRARAVAGLELLFPHASQIEESILKMRLVEDKMEWRISKRNGLKPDPLLWNRPLRETAKAQYCGPLQDYTMGKISYILDLERA